MNIFCQVLKDHQTELTGLNMNIDELGSHTVCKGSATLCASGCTAVPPITSICLCAGWSMGNAKSHHIQYEVAGDQFCGRAVTGLNHIISDFGISCCYFEGGDSKDIDEYIQNIIAAGHSLSELMFIVSKYLLVAFLCHYNFLCKTLTQRTACMPSSA
eukprot:11191420-Ditylum_brightwellii.AAC.1